MGSASPPMEGKGAPRARAANAALGRRPTENFSRQKRYQVWLTVRKELISRRERHLRSGPTRTLVTESFSTHQ